MKNMDPKDRVSTQEELDNYSRQLNPEDDTYWQARGFDEKPDDYQERLKEDDD